jgi:DNA-binding CsgD family transcriptional regulator
MGHCNHLRLPDVRAAFRLIGEVSELGPDPFAWRMRLFEGLCQLTGAVAAIGGESEGLFVLDSGARPLQLFYSGLSAHDRRVHQDYLGRYDFVAIDPALRRICRCPHRVLTGSHNQLLTRDDWHQSVVFHEYMRPLGLDDRILSFSQMTKERSVSLWNGVTLVRENGDRPFSDRACRLVHLVHGELQPLMGKRLATCRGQQNRPLSPRLRQTLDLLLMGDSEKQIATKCGLAQSTVHEYVTALYRRYEVSGRAELMARFLDWHGTPPADSAMGGHEQ